MISMKRGNDKDSYGNNSDGLARSAHSLHPFLEETLEKIPLPFPNEQSFTIADLGCAFGKNPIEHADFIVNHVIKLCKSNNNETPEFQVFLSDLPSNDFNTLFNLVTSDEKNRRYYVAGVPGSFYNRLFPSKSINVFHSTFSVHWLSEVPADVTDEASRAYNKGRVFVHGASEATGAAYKKQFMSDLSRFLEARAREMKHCGVMYLVCCGRDSTDPTNQAGLGALFGTIFEDTWDDLVKEGHLEGEKRDKFNVPVYAPTVDEFKEAIEANGSYHINTLELNLLEPKVYTWPAEEGMAGKSFTNCCSMVVEDCVKANIGEELTKEFFVRMEKKAVRREKEIKQNLCCYYSIVCSLSMA